MFQSRNRGSFLFKHQACCASVSMIFMFQSRNRGSFLFKSLGLSVLDTHRSTGFNLVIEVLFFSRTPDFVDDPDADAILFQSRNRGSFLFKFDPRKVCIMNAMFQSRNRGSFLFKCQRVKGENEHGRFQSRNRGSFLFKFEGCAVNGVGLPVSIS